MKRDMRVARTPTNKAANNFDGDSDNSDEADCKASNTGGTDDEEEGEDADDCESRRFRTMKGDKRFFLPKMQVLLMPLRIFLSSWEEFRKKYDRAFKATGWEPTNTKKADAAFESIQHLEDAHQCGYPRAKANLVAASVSVKNQLGKINSWTQQNKMNELQTQALVLQGCTRRHSDLRRDGGLHADQQDLCDGGKVSRGGECAGAKSRSRRRSSLRKSRSHWRSG